MKTITEDIKNRSFKRCYLLFGDEKYLVHQYTQNLMKAIVADGDSMNVFVASGKDVTEQQVIDLSETLPFFAEYRLLVLEDSGLFSSPSDAFVSYMSQIPETTILIFREEKADKRGRLYKAISKYGYAAEMKRQTDQTLTKWILSLVKKEKKQITQDAISLFRDMVGDDMQAIRSELDKLFAYTLDRDSITIDDIAAVCCGETENRVFEMVDAITTKDQKKAFHLYADLAALKEPSGRILYLIERQYNLMLQAKELSAKGRGNQEIADLLSLRPFAVKKTLSQAARYRIADLKEDLEKCVMAEEAFKTGKMGDKLSLEMLIFELSKR